MTTSNTQTQSGAVEATTPALMPYVRQKTVLLTTFRRDGRPVGTPVHLVVVGDRAFFRTWDQAWKFKRLRNNPEVTIAPSTGRGKPTGPAIRAGTRPLAGAEAATAARALRSKYPFVHGVVVPLYHRLNGLTTVHFELRPIEE